MQKQWLPKRVSLILSSSYQIGLINVEELNDICQVLNSKENFVKRVGRLDQNSLILSQQYASRCRSTTSSPKTQHQWAVVISKLPKGLNPVDLDLASKLNMVNLSLDPETSLLRDLQLSHLDSLPSLPCCLLPRHPRIIVVDFEQLVNLIQ